MHRTTPPPDPSSKFPRRRGLLLAVTSLVWLGAVGGGFTILAREQFTPAPGVAAQAAFPLRSALALAPDRPTLIVFAHPHCPCTRATLHELDALLAETGERLAVTVAFTLPPGVAHGWERGELWQRVSQMPDVRAVIDHNGAEALRFGVKTSGHALLYTPGGQLIFSGGITASRGHEGDNISRSSIARLARGEGRLVGASPVFGCPLLERE